jgi:hypothetical protein
MTVFLLVVPDARNARAGTVLYLADPGSAPHHFVLRRARDDAVSQ